MFDVITLGSAVYDCFVQTDRKSTEIIRLRHPKENAEHIAFPTGAKILIDSASFDIGGGATNSATAFSRLGLKSGAICNVGNDSYGKMIQECLRAEKIEFLGKVTNEHTDFSIVLDNQGHDRTLFAFKGAGNTITYGQVNLSKIKSKWLYVSTLMEGSYKTAEKLSAYARKKGIEVAFNPSTYLARKGSKFLSRMLKNTNLIVLNKEEAMLISGQKEMGKMLVKLSSFGPQIVVITDGKNGADAFRDGTRYHIDSRKDTKIVETTGAGDAFASSFLAGLMKTDDMKFALSMGAANAESVISHFGAHNKLLSWREAASMMKKRPHRIKLFK